MYGFIHVAKHYSGQQESREQGAGFLDPEGSSTMLTTGKAAKAGITSRRTRKQLFPWKHIAPPRYYGIKRPETVLSKIHTAKKHDTSSTSQTGHTQLQRLAFPFGRACCLIATGERQMLINQEGGVWC